MTGAEAEAAKRRLRDAANQIRAGRREMIAARLVGGNFPVV
ncbi:MAG: hypothetical protein R3F11_13310 [Verrucomicrobiales bacterium]